MQRSVKEEEKAGPSVPDAASKVSLHYVIVTKACKSCPHQPLQHLNLVWPSIRSKTVKFHCWSMSISLQLSHGCVDIGRQRPHFGIDGVIY